MQLDSNNINIKLGLPSVRVFYGLLPITSINFVWFYLRLIVSFFFVSPLVFAVRSFQRLKLKLNPKVNITSDVKLPIPLVNYLLAKLTLLENKILLCKPFGSSLFVVAKKHVS